MFPSSSMRMARSFSQLRIQRSTCSRWRKRSRKFEKQVNDVYRQPKKTKQVKKTNYLRASLSLAWFQLPHLSAILHVVRYRQPFLSKTSLSLAWFRLPHLSAILRVVRYRQPFLSKNLCPAMSLASASLTLSQNIVQVTQRS